jgi:antitoxin HicB
MTGYPIRVERDDNGTFLITSPAFPEVTSFAEDAADVPTRARAAIEEAIAARMAAGEKVPPPQPRQGRESAQLSLLSALKVTLHLTALRQNVSRAELARRLSWHREQVDRLFRLNHASKLDQLESAFKALDRSIDIRVPLKANKPGLTSTTGVRRSRRRS